MAKYTDLAAREVGVVIDADTAMANSPYLPLTSGRLIKVTVVAGGIAATSLIENGHIKLVCSAFGGVDEYIPFNGIGLETVPRDHKPIIEHECDLAVKEGTPIRMFYYYNVLPVTPELTVYFTIES